MFSNLTRFFDPLLLDRRLQSRWEEVGIEDFRDFLRNLLMFCLPSPGHEIPKSRRGRVAGTEDFGKICSKLTHFLIPFSWTRDSKVEGEQERMIFQKFFNKCFRNSLNFLLLFPGHEIPKSMGRGRDGGFSRNFFETYSFFDPLLLDTRFQSRGRSRPSVGTEDFREFFRNSFIF